MRNAFVAKLAGDGGSLTYATLFLVDVGNPALDLVVDEDGAAHVSGRVESDDFPATAGAFRETRPGGLDGFVCKIVPAGNEFAFATWKSARGALPKAALAFDPAKGKFALKLSRFDYAGVPTNPVAIDLAFGDDAGAAESAWTQRRPGLLKFPR